MKEKVKNNRLPFGLCMKYDIPIKKHWTPTDAWNALKEKTGKDMLQFFRELNKEEIEKHARIEFFPKDKAHPKEVTSAVFDKIKTYRRQLSKKGEVFINVSVGDCEYYVKLFNAENDYDYEIIRRRKIK